MGNRNGQPRELICWNRFQNIYRNSNRTADDITVPWLLGNLARGGNISGMDYNTHKEIAESFVATQQAV